MNEFIINPNSKIVGEVNNKRRLAKVMLQLTVIPNTILFLIYLVYFRYDWLPLYIIVQVIWFTILDYIFILRSYLKYKKYVFYVKFEENGIVLKTFNTISLNKENLSSYLLSLSDIHLEENEGVVQIQYNSRAYLLLLHEFEMGNELYVKLFDAQKASKNLIFQ